MKILQIARQFYPAIGGIEAVTLGLSKALQAAGHECDVATLEYIRQLDKKVEPYDIVEGISVYRISHIGSMRYPIAPRIIDLVRSYEVLHIHAIDFFVDYLSLTRFWHKKPIVVSTHGGIFHTSWLKLFKKFWFNSITRISLQGVDWVVADSRHDFELFRPIISSEKLLYIPNGVDFNTSSHLPRRPQKGLLVGVGRIADNKRIEMILQSVSRLDKEFPDIFLTWIGPGSTTDMDLMRDLSAELGIIDRVTFTDRISIEERDAWLKRAHLFVSASEYEAFGVSTIEAMSAGVVPVVTRVGIHPEVVQTGRSGWLWSGDVDSLTETLRQAMNTNTVQLAKMSKRARFNVERFRWDNIAEEFIELYKEALDLH